MRTIQEKIESLKGGEAIQNLIEAHCSLCNIATNDGRVLIASRYEVSPLIVTSGKELDRAVPKAVYCIAVPADRYYNMLGQEVVLDLSYGGKGISMNTKIKNNDLRLIDALGGEENVTIGDGGDANINDRLKLILNDNDKVEFWDVTLVSMNQIGGVVY
ncbi:MAG: hypothetical protein HDQ88_04960 [Clostridia bacterium]|nr:hypothetical protein [Clostridia bacterium]